MVLTLQEIINEADLLVPNAYSNVDKIIWLNAINQYFFDIVKIQNVSTFTSAASTSSYTLTGNIKIKNRLKTKISA